MKKILVVEDNYSNFILMSYVLKHHYEFFRAVNGQEAVEKVEEEDYDLILMDINMPVMNGIEATRLIKAKHPSLPIIAITANAFDTDREHAMEAGCDDFMAKPISSEKCLKIIAKYI